MPLCLFYTGFWCNDNNSKKSLSDIDRRSTKFTVLSNHSFTVWKMRLHYSMATDQYRSITGDTESKAMPNNNNHGLLNVCNILPMWMI